MTDSLKDRVRKHHDDILDSFTNLLRSAKVAEENVDLARSQGAKVPGELMEVFVEKLLQSCAALLGVIAELKRNALLNDCAARNAEVEAARGLAGEEVQQLEARYAAVRAQIQQALEQLESRQLLPRSAGEPPQQDAEDI